MSRSDYAERILRVLVHIQHNLDAALSLDELARIAHFSPFHFHRIFRGMTGESVKQHVRRLRLERAAHQLRRTDLPVTHVAFDAGYEAHEAFTRAFSQAFGCSPSAFRSTGEATLRLSSPNLIHYIAAGDDLAFEPASESAAMRVELKELPALRVAFVTHIGPYAEVGGAWERLMDWAGAECLVGPEHAHFGACWSDPDITPPDEIRYDASIVIGADTVVPEGIETCVIEAARSAVATHHGPYPTIGQTYAQLLGVWLAANPYELADPPALEFYLNDPETTEPEELLTDIYMRIR